MRRAACVRRESFRKAAGWWWSANGREVDVWLEGKLGDRLQIGTADDEAEAASHCPRPAVWWVDLQLRPRLSLGYDWPKLTHSEYRLHS